MAGSSAVVGDCYTAVGTASASYRAATRGDSPDWAFKAAPVVGAGARCHALCSLSSVQEAETGDIIFLYLYYMYLFFFFFLNTII
jgi:hypothetical protein